MSGIGVGEMETKTARGSGDSRETGRRGRVEEYNKDELVVESKT